jgi:hypothetical protein
MIGVVPLTPYKKPEYRDLTPAELLFNRQVNRRRWVVEQGIAHLRTWKGLKTGYRRPLRKAGRTLQTVLKLQMYRRHSKDVRLV